MVTLIHWVLLLLKSGHFGSTRVQLIPKFMLDAKDSVLKIRLIENQDILRKLSTSNYLGPVLWIGLYVIDPLEMSALLPCYSWSLLLLGNLVDLYRSSASAGSQALPILLEYWKKLENIKMEAFY